MVGTTFFFPRFLCRLATFLFVANDGSASGRLFVCAIAALQGILLQVAVGQTCFFADIKTPPTLAIANGLCVGNGLRSIVMSLKLVRHRNLGNVLLYPSLSCLQNCVALFDLFGASRDEAAFTSLDVFHIRLCCGFSITQFIPAIETSFARVASNMYEALVWSNLDWFGPERSNASSH